MSSGSDQGFSVFIEGLSCPPEEFALGLISQGMDATRVDQLIRAIPCYLKTNVTRQDATRFGAGFEQAGGIIRIEAHDPVVAAATSKPPPARPRPIATPRPVRPLPEPLALDLGDDAAEPFVVDSASPAEAAAGIERTSEVGGSHQASPAGPGAGARAPTPSFAAPSAADLLPPLDLRPSGVAAAPTAASAGVGGGARDLDLLPPPQAGATSGPEIEDLAIDLGPPGGGFGPASPSPGMAADALEIDLPPPQPVANVSSPVGPAGPGLAHGPGGPGARQPGKPEHKPIVLRRVPEPDPDPWLKRRYPHLIAITLLLVVASYLYGCTKVMSSATQFRRDVSDVNRLLENMNARRQTVTDADVVAAVYDVGKRCDLDIGGGDIHILAEELGQYEIAPGTCRFAKTPDAFQRLPPTDQQMLLKSVQYCGAPDWILTIRIESKARWGLFSHTIDATVTTWVRTYEP